MLFRLRSRERLPRRNSKLGDSISEKLTMNIQIFGTKKSSDTRKAERFFKERGIKFQFVDLKEKAMSKGEFQSVLPQKAGRI